MAAVVDNTVVSFTVRLEQTDPLAWAYFRPLGQSHLKSFHKTSLLVLVHNLISGIGMSFLSYNFALLNVIHLTCQVKIT